MPVLTWAQNDAGARPGSRECLEGRVLISAGYGDTIRWREGERLEGLYEARCDWPEYLLCGTRQLLIFAGYVALAAVQPNLGVSWVETSHGPLVFDDACHIIGDGAVLRTGSFAMKGEHIPPHARWRGNPAAGASDHDGRRPPAAQLATHEPSS